MSQKANYFKLGLFVIGAIAAGVVVLLIIGSGRWLTKRITIETYFNESVQGLDIGSKLKYRGVAVGEVTRIGFSYNKYQLDRPMAERARYVLVEAQLEPKALGGRAGAGDLTNNESAGQEVERGLRVRLAPLGITGTSYLEVDYIDPPPPTLQIDWTPEYIYIPSARSTVTAIVNAASEIMERLHKLDIEGTLANVNKLLVTTNQRVESIDTKALSQRAERVLGKMETTLDNIDSKKLSNEAIALMADVRASNAELKKVLANPSFQKLPDEAAATLARMRTLVDDPNLSRSVQNLSRSLARLDRILGGGEADLATTVENLRQITDNLRDLTEDAKRYPANVILGGPPPPPESRP
jgi:ABC-type transporter Mla subunit MlaD